MRPIKFLFCLFFFNYSFAQCWLKIDAGDLQTMALKSDGTIYYWGNNQLLFPVVNVETQIGTSNDWKEIAAAFRHGMSIKNDGTLWGWGLYGQFGNGSTDNLLVPTQIGTDTDWKSIFTQGSDTFVLKNNGTLWASGGNLSGSTGTGLSGFQVNTFTQVLNGSNWKIVSKSGHTVLALKEDNTLWAWGDNLYGQIGNGNFFAQDEPILISSSSWQSIAGGVEHSLAVKSDGTLWSWGRNQYGQLGDGTLVNKNIPTQVGTDSDWESVGAGYAMSYALKQDGRLFYFGINTSGQAGNGTTGSVNVLMPTQVGSQSDWDKLYVGYNFIVASKTNGYLYGWGNNIDGQLGIGNYISKNLPTLISTCVLSTENFSRPTVKVYPNPVTTILTIQTKTAIDSVTIYDTLGKKVYEQESAATQIDVSNFAKGLYLLQTTIEGVVSMNKFVKE
jgi:alpha-tubulin suppressor-like RCC1 family protein